MKYQVIMHLMPPNAIYKLHHSFATDGFSYSLSEQNWTPFLGNIHFSVSFNSKTLILVASDLNCLIFPRISWRGWLHAV